MTIIIIIVVVASVETFEYYAGWLLSMEVVSVRAEESFLKTERGRGTCKFTCQMFCICFSVAIVCSCHFVVK